MAMLTIKDLEVYYGVIQAIKGVSFEVNQGEVIALIGANGAGKTTILHTITGLLAPKNGSVVFEGKELTKMPAHKIVSLGMAHVPEGRRVFADLSVYENLRMGAYTRKDRNEIEETLEKVYQRFPRLKERRNQMAGTLSGGEQHILANVAWGRDNRFDSEWRTKTKPLDYFLAKDKDWESKFHVWRMDWDENFICLYLDGELLNRVPLTETVNGAYGNHTNPFKQPQYVLLNLALGGRNGGKIDGAAMPMKYEIDYVRVYKKK